MFFHIPGVLASDLGDLGDLGYLGDLECFDGGCGVWLGDDAAPCSDDAVPRYMGCPLWVMGITCPALSNH